MKLAQVIAGRKLLLAFVQLAVCCVVLNVVPTAAQPSGTVTLGNRASFVRNSLGVPRITGQQDADAYYALGYLHAQDRFFQMDVSRRQASGTLGSLVGAGANDSVLRTDIQLRTFGLRRAAIRSRDAYPTAVINLLQAYADGVNLWLNENPLPPEYVGLEITSVPRWDVVDSLAVAKLLSFGLSFDSDDLNRTVQLATYQAVGQAVGFNGQALFFQDVVRTAPFDPTLTIFPFAQPVPASETAAQNSAGEVEQIAPDVKIAPETVEAIQNYLASTADLELLNQPKDSTGSNWFVVSGARTTTGSAMMANDPHLSLSSPPVFYEVGLRTRNFSERFQLNVFGVSFPGVPGIVQGFNDRIQWGSTVNPLDVTDFYQEQVVINAQGIPVATRYQGNLEPLAIIPEVFQLNQPGNGTPDDVAPVAPGTRPSGAAVPPATFVVPRRNNGALITAPAGPSPTQLTAISVQYSGLSATREIETFLGFARARSVSDFRRALQFFDVGSQNWVYADRSGNIAYFASGEQPLREDLQAGTVDGLPPYFVRDGSGTLRNEWIRRDNVPADQALNYEILPFEELPQLVNPAAGFIVNANNDPVGTSLDNNPINQLRPGGGLYYLSPGYAIGNRAGRIDTRLRAEFARRNRRISLRDMASIQADVKLRDAEALNNYIIQAFDAADAPGAPPELAAFAADPAVRDAVARLRTWDFSTPTGIDEGYDAGDLFRLLFPPTAGEIRNSTAATIYSVWRGQILQNTVDATLARVGLGQALPNGGAALVALRNLLDNYATNQGRGASGLNFFDVPGVTLSPTAERDIVILASLRNGLNLLSGDAFAAAFGNSTNLNDYRWGRLHRITFRHPLGNAALPFNIPPGAGFNDLSPQLPGISTDGGYDVVDASSHDARADSVNEFMFGSGPARRFVGEARSTGINAFQVIPGGASGVAGSRFFGNTLGTWLVNDFNQVGVNGR